jgi:hypothetical protein
VHAASSSPAALYRQAHALDIVAAFVLLAGLAMEAADGRAQE